jgi:hypothetical protein
LDGLLMMTAAKEKRAVLVVEEVRGLRVLDEDVLARNIVSNAAVLNRATRRMVACGFRGMAISGPN